MTPDARDWTDGLRRFSEEHRAPRHVRRVPVPSGNHANPDPAADVASAAQGEILAACLSTWRSTVLAAAFESHPDVAVVLTTSPPGMAAADAYAASLAPADAARFVAVTEKAYRGWCMRAPDEAHRLHVILWSWIKAPLPAARHAEFARWPIGPSEAYWLHRRGGGDHAGTWYATDLYRWDGSQATLLARDLVERLGKDR